MRRRALFLGLSLVLATCSGGGGNNNAGECENGATQCAGNTFQSCENGAWETTSQCLGLCDPGLGCVDCQPGTSFCTGNDVHVCDDSGNDTGASENCGDLFCSGGQCRDLCADAVESASYIGCEYFAVDLDNAIETSSLNLFEGPTGGTRQNDLFGCSFALLPTPLDLDVCVNDTDSDDIAGLCENGGTFCPTGHTCSNEPMCVFDAQSSPFAVVVANPQNVDLDITVEDGTQTMTVPVASGEVKAIYPAELGFAAPQINGTSQQTSAFKLSARAPFVAYQFNPLDNEGVFSNDGSLLLPTHTWDSRYYAITLPSLVRRGGTPDTNDYNGYITLVGNADGTEITVTPTADVRPGVSLPAITAGTPTTFTLNAFETLNLEAVGEGDLTGTLVEATDPAASYGLFAGHEAVVVDQECCADHIEEMMFPTSTWGTSYAVARSKERGAELDTVRIIAQEANTAVTVSDGSCPTLNAGGFCEIKIAGDLEITADKPIMVGHFLSSEGGELGDPSMAIAVPTEQYRTQYSFLVPAEYDEQYVSIVSTAGGTVLLDNTDVSSNLQTMGSGDYAAGWVQLQPGQHEITCPDKCGIVVYGYSAAVSYRFAGGLDLTRIVVD
jgi:hypothetical protein